MHEIRESKAANVSRMAQVRVRIMDHYRARARTVDAAGTFEPGEAVEPTPTPDDSQE